MANFENRGETVSKGRNQSARYYPPDLWPCAGGRELYQLCHRNRWWG